jgi:hypothetical protein
VNGIKFDVFFYFFESNKPNLQRFVCRVPVSPLVHKGRLARASEKLPCPAIFQSLVSEVDFRYASQKTLIHFPLRFDRRQLTEGR